MNLLDLVLILPIAWGIIMGWRSGLIMQLAMMAAMIIGGWVAMHYSGQIARFLGGFDEKYQLFWNSLAFVLVIVSILLLLKLAAMAATRMMSKTPAGTANKIGGMLLGGLKYTAFVCAVVVFLEWADARYPFMDMPAREHSLLYFPLYKLAWAVWGIF